MIESDAFGPTESQVVEMETILQHESDKMEERMAEKYH